MKSFAPAQVIAAIATLGAFSALSAFPAVAQAEPATYVVDGTHTYVTFAVLHFGTSTRAGRFDKTEGSVTIDPAAKTGKADITIDPASINSGTEKFNDHLKSKDFFSVAEFPTAKFAGDKFKFDGDKVVEVAGTLTLHGVSQPVTLKATHYNCYQSPMLKKQVCGGDFETSIKRSAYGITYGLPFVPDDVRLVIEIEAVKQ